MNVIVETGAGVANANSYVGVQDAINYASSRGLSLPCSPQEVQQLAFQAMDYIESFEGRFGGSRTLTTQSLSHPRTGNYIYCEEFSSTAIPKQLKDAQVQTMVAIHAGFDPQANIGSEPFIIEEMLGPMKVKYAYPQQVGVSLTAVFNLLKPLFGGSGAPVVFRRA